MYLGYDLGWWSTFARSTWNILESCIYKYIHIYIYKWLTKWLTHPLSNYISYIVISFLKNACIAPYMLIPHVHVTIQIIKCSSLYLILSYRISVYMFLFDLILSCLDLSYIFVCYVYFFLILAYPIPSYPILSIDLSTYLSIQFYSIPV